MRHRVAGRKLSRTSEHRLAMRRNLVASLFEHETVSTTLQKAKEVRSFAEKLITLAKKGDLAARRRAISMLGNRDIISEEDGNIVKTGSVVGKLFSELGPRYLDRPGGYTRIIRLSMNRLGDNGQVVLLQLVGQTKGLDEKAESTGKKGSKKKSAKTEEPVEQVEVTEADAVEPQAEAVEAEAVEAEEVKNDAKEAAAEEKAEEPQASEKNSEENEAEDKQN